MCGIGGVFSADREERINPSILDRMLEAMRNRGPDDGASVSLPGLELGARRLAIVNIVDGRQPVTSADGRVVAVLNGELFGFRALRSTLVQHGHSFRSESDTEVLVHGYEQWGIEGLLERLNGMFAFAIYDQRTDQLIIARDRLGIKPLVYAEVNCHYYFASSTRALLATGSIGTDPDPIGVRLFLHNQFVPSPFTILKQVKKLQPGTYVVVGRKDRGRAKSYWQAPRTLRRQTSETEWRDSVRAVVADAVRAQQVADVEVGLLLSGGLDSSVILAAMSRPTRSFAVAVTDDSAWNEIGHAREAANRLQSNLDVCSFDATEADSTITPMIENMDDPLGDPACMPAFVLAQRTSEHVKVAMSGEGADELFAGYGYYDHHAGRLARCARGVRPLRKLIAARRSRDLVEFMTCYRDRSATSSYPHVMPAPVCDALARDLGCEQTTQDLQNDLERPWREAGHGDDMNNALDFDAHFWLADNLLAKADQMGMAHGLEIRVPFLDHRLVELASQMPSSFKRRRGLGKRVLRDAFADKLGSRITERVKHGLGMPLGAWMRTPLRDTIEAMLSEELVPPWLNRELVAEIVRRHMGGRCDFTRPVWTLFVLSRWFAFAATIAQNYRSVGRGGLATATEKTSA